MGFYAAATATQKGQNTHLGHIGVACSLVAFWPFPSVPHTVRRLLLPLLNVSANLAQAPPMSAIEGSVSACWDHLKISPAGPEGLN